MSEIFLLFLSLSVSGSILALVLIILKPVLKEKLSKTWHYYIYLIIIFRLLIPFSPEISVVGEMFSQINHYLTVQETEKGIPLIKEEKRNVFQLPQNNTDVETALNSYIEHEKKTNYSHTILSNLWIVWIVVALSLFVRKITVYHSFVHFMKVGCHEIGNAELCQTYQALCATLKIRKPPAVYQNDIASGPMLIGIMRPFIVLPDIPIKNKDMAYVLQHELIHYKRCDILYKWLVQLAVCFHWFNPFVYLLSKEINHNCELSCDETMIRELDQKEKYAYGDTLLSTIKPDKGYSNSIVSITLNENTKLIKERLVAIMNYKKRSIVTAFASLILTIVLLCGAAFTGAYATPTKIIETMPLSYWELPSKTLPHIEACGQVLHTSNLQMGSYQLDAADSYTLTISWQDGSNTLKTYLVGKDGGVEEYILSNDQPVNIRVPKSGLYYLKSPRNRETGDMRDLSYRFQQAENPSVHSTVTPIKTVNSETIPVTIEACKIQVEDTPYKWPYIVHQVKNNSDQAIKGYQIALLAYDKDGKPMELFWDARNVAQNGETGSVGFGPGGVDYGIVTGIAPYSPKSYEWIIDEDFVEIASGKAAIVDGWTLFDGWWDQPKGVHKANYMITCIKQISFEDETVWENPKYSSWLASYKGKPVDLQMLESYYPYE